MIVRKKRPVIKCSICTGEQVAGFQDIHNGTFEDVMLIRGKEDLKVFRKKYGIPQDRGDSKDILIFFHIFNMIAECNPSLFISMSLIPIIVPPEKIVPILSIIQSS